MVDQPEAREGAPGTHQLPHPPWLPLPTGAKLPQPASSLLPEVARAPLKAVCLAMFVTPLPTSSQDTPLPSAAAGPLGPKAEGGAGTGGGTGTWLVGKGEGGRSASQR